MKRGRIIKRIGEREKNNLYKALRFQKLHKRQKKNTTDLDRPQL